MVRLGASCHVSGVRCGEPGLARHCALGAWGAVHLCGAVTFSQKGGFQLNFTSNTTRSVWVSRVVSLGCRVVRQVWPDTVLWGHGGGGTGHLYGAMVSIKIVFLGVISEILT